MANPHAVQAGSPDPAFAPMSVLAPREGTRPTP